MCPAVSACPERQSMPPARNAHWLRAIALFVMVLSLTQNSLAQTVDSIEIRTIDMRGQNPVSASLVAIKNSRNDVVVVQIRGGSQELIEQTEGQLKALVSKGYDRLGVILCDLTPGEIAPVIGIVADGTVFAAIKGAQVNAQTKLDTYRLVNEAYRETVLPKPSDSLRKKN
ncbi:MAG: hypothetical protein H6577_10090 [Lewinellaceae bacterium]|nr:hypothetical protein [Saprospiraceae bacterium]MCB9338467.1 hypothetical protein [Lewinellaceae bacterium]